MDNPSEDRGGANGLRSAIRRVALFAWRVVRPVARPLLWRMRSFLTIPVLNEMQHLRAGQEGILHAIADLASARRAHVEAGGGASAGAGAAARGAALRSVHQFHSGSATADAITNAMLLLRGLLRAAGYASEIFVEHVDPALVGQVLPLEAMPRHADYVLIVRHSIGHGAFDRIAALPAPKLLHYHNVTPPEFFADDPAMAAAAAEGRRQLAAWRGQVVGATADSAFNALDLRALGYQVVLECPLLFDVEALRQRAAAAARPRQAGAPFTVLFVGRLVESKGQAALIEAFAAFREAFGAPAGLVLIGRGSEAAATALRVLADRLGLGAAVELRGVVPDHELDAAYAAADLYVSLSRHEGFGVPLAEAMAHGVPVLAWPAGAVPYTLGEAGALLADRSPRAVGEAMAALARDPARRAALVEAGHRRLDDFAPAKSWPVLQSALALAGAAPSPAPGLGPELAANLHLTVAGHFNGSYSLAVVNRTLVGALEKLLPGRVAMQVYEAGVATAFSPPIGEGGSRLAAIAARGAPPTGPDVVICQHYPPLHPAREGDLTLAMLFWEETLVPGPMVAALSEFRAVLVPTAAVAKALTRFRPARAGVAGRVRAGACRPCRRRCGTAGQAAGHARRGDLPQRLVRLPAQGPRRAAGGVVAGVPRRRPGPAGDQGVPQPAQRRRRPDRRPPGRRPRHRRNRADRPRHRRRRRCSSSTPAPTPWCCPPAARASTFRLRRRLPPHCP